MAKCLVIFPPQWAPFSVHLAPVTISANIRKAGHLCDICDLNIEFYHEVLKKDFLEQIVVNAVKSLPDLIEELKPIYSTNKKPEDYSIEEQIKAKKLLFIKNIQENKLEESKKVIDNVENALALLKDKNMFYNLNLAANSIGIIDKALEIVSITEFPQEFSLYYFKNRSIKLNWNGILEYCNQDNIFNRFYSKKAVDIIKKKYDYIGISISSSSQFLSALILAKLLKSKARKTKICLGGNHISRVIDAIKKNPEFFNVYADYVIYEEGERASIELIEHIEGKRELEDVSSIVYLDKNKKVKINPQKTPIPLSELATGNLEGFKINDYLLPEIIMPVQLSRGCYWKKCTFCDHYFGQTYNVKNIDKLIKELKTYQSKYGINNFEFTDDCISPAFLKEFSQKVIEEGLKINWYCDLRLEDAFSEELLTLAYNAGLKMVLWGFESGSKRIMELINKGVDIEKRYEILKRARKAGIYNFAYIFTGFPTETFDEAMQTINAVCNNPDLFHAYGTGIFSLGKHSFINSNPEKFGIKKLEDDEEFSSEAKYIIEKGLTNQDLENLDKEITKNSLIERNNPAWMFLCYRELLFLYIVKYGRDKVLQMKYK